MSRKSGTKEPGDLLGDATKEKLARAQIKTIAEKLYPQLLKTKQKIVEARDVAIAAIDSGELPIIPEREANILVRTPQFRAWMDDENVGGRRNAYKTPKRGRQPFDECEQKELAFDIIEKCLQGDADRTALRKDIMNFKSAFNGAMPIGENGERVPDWIWNEWDEKGWELTMRHTKDHEPEKPPDGT